MDNDFIYFGMSSNVVYKETGKVNGKPKYFFLNS